MTTRKKKTPAIIRIRALNSFVLVENDIGHLEYKAAGHELQFMREGSEFWEPIEVESQVVGDWTKPES